MPVYLKDLPPADRDDDFIRFNETAEIVDLGWPSEVVKQWLYDHGDRPDFLADYANLDLGRIRWNLELVSVTDLEHIPTGPADQEWLDQVAAEHHHWLGVRLPRYRDAWETRGTWIDPPVLISRDLLDPLATGLQVIEGRTRVGILQGRRAESLNVSEFHKAWVGRASR